MLEKIQCGRFELDLKRPQVMGVLNVTPDSFSDGGDFFCKDVALRQAERMINDGAAIIDVGGESTRPGAVSVSVQEELERVVPVVEVIANHFPVIVSVDTSTAQVISAVAAVGAGLLNDVRALQREGALEAAVQTNLPICLMHMQGQPGSMQKNPQYKDDVVVEVGDFLRRRVDVCVAAGISKARLLLDPGFGFGKTLDHNLTLLASLERFEDFDLPLLVGLSRKSMIGAVTDNPVDQRLAGSVAAAVIAATNGAKIIRAHDVAETVDALKMVSAVKGVSCE